MIRLAELAARIARFEPEPAQQRALQTAARHVEDAVRAALRQTPGGIRQTQERSQEKPERSISHGAERSRAVIGSTSSALRDQELGTRRELPRPTFGPVATQLGESTAAAVAREIAEAIRAALAGKSGSEDL